MFLLGVASLFQFCVLPGLLIGRCFRLANTQRLALMLPLSLLGNYFLVYGLTLAGWYTKHVMIDLAVVEIIAIGALYYRPAAAALTPKGPLDHWAPISPRVHFALLALAGFATSWLVLQALPDTPRHFTGYDDPCNWNRWAMSWFEGKLPVQTQEYPQLVPTSWSVVYKMMNQSDITCFVTFANGLIPLGIVGMFWSLYRDSRNPVFLLAVALVAALLEFMVGIYIGVGMADIPVALFGAASLFVSCLLINRRIGLTQYVVLGGLITAGAAVTKQAGLYTIVYYLAVLLYGCGRDGLPWRRRGLAVAAGIAIVGVLGVSWYVQQRLLYLAGHETSNIQHVTQGIYGDETYWQRFAIANRNLMTHMSWLTVLWPGQLVFAAVMGSVAVLTGLAIRASAFGALVSLVVTIPFYLIWGFFFSYGPDARNFTLAAPFIAVSVATGFMTVLGQGLPRLMRDHRRALRVGGAAVAVGLIVLAVRSVNRTYTHDTMLASQIDYLEYRPTLARQRPSLPLYLDMYDRYRAHQLDGPVLTNFGCDNCDVFPGTGHRFVTSLSTYANDPGLIPMLRFLILSGQYHYYLFYSDASVPPWYRTGLDRLLAEGKLTVITQAADENASYVLYRIVLPGQ